MKKMVLHMACGLCNRLRSAASALCVCRQRQIPLGVDWRAYSSCPEGDMRKLFEIPDGLELVTAPMWVAGGDYQTTLRLEIDDVTYLQGFYAMGGPDAFRYFCDDELTISALWAGTTKIVRSFRPIAALREKIAAVTATWPAGPIVGVHVRRTDFGQLLGKHTEANAKLLDEMHARAPDTNFFVASDNPETVAMLRGFFGGRIYTYVRPWLTEGKRRTTVADAVVDLYALAATSGIIGVKDSSFSQYACWLGNKPIIYLGT